MRAMEPWARRHLTEWRRSWWVLLTLFPLGLFSWAGFLYAGVKARQKRWFVAAAVYGAAMVAGFALAQDAPDDSLRDTAAGMLLLLPWIFSIGHALATRGSYVERVELLESPHLDAAEDRLEARRIALEMVEESPVRARELGIGRPDLPGAFHCGLVDVNNAAASALAELPGIDDATARRAVELREELNGFSSVLDFGHLLDLPPHTVDRLREHAVCLPR